MYNVFHYSVVTLSRQLKMKWWMSLGFAIVEAVILACYSLLYSIYVASHMVKHVMLTSMLLVCGVMTMTWICDTITESRFGMILDLLVTWLAAIWFCSYGFEFLLTFHLM
ncbi:putative SecY/SEC61-alpha family protein [Rosa chinensis]|uniref:Putative SecY/SEC61-alpha family protein n=1 Tax=Rosa chinensis TaxID=74649 RepID=A0A2P6PRD7_ROSCH|nr:putative SecY/SEC61-alpha family protein [Rosa chinensis]